MKTTRISIYERAFIFIAIITIILMMSGCAYLEVESKTVIDYRYTSEYDYVTQTKEGNDIITRGYHEKEQFELLYEYTYADGHTERRWEDCTRFEYQNAKEELGEIEE